MDAVFGEGKPHTHELHTLSFSSAHPHHTESAQAESDPNSETSSLVPHSPTTLRTERATRAPSPEPEEEPNYKPPERTSKSTSLWHRILGRGPEYQAVGDDA
jgi:hypothetical protein